MNSSKHDSEFMDALKPAVEMRPTDPSTGEPIGPMSQPGYYPNFSTLSQQNFWDATTREVILDRVNNVPPIRFFTPAEARLLEAVCARVLPQDDRDELHRIPIVPHIDKRLFEKSYDGYRYEDMPPDPEAFQLGLRAIDEIAHHQYGCSFLEIGPREQDQILCSLHDGKPAAGFEVWDRMPVHRFWMLLVQDCAGAYYSHPWAWDEIGFGGPAYPRAYTRLERGEPEPWECEEKRYAWEAPESSVSAAYEYIAGLPEHLGSPGQGGTH
jgi:Gluconate 2-dehydrogenase subunit 3